ncbi:PIN-like domain-containing protein [Senegalia sp. (in: firmicutes)]|uniref:PIN-like domain-containing protein n=1 Tax=Senegalia sp. (in: firmicutes) TaxID=1924098 RepID=UPI003F9D708D
MSNIKEKFPEFFQDRIESQDLENSSNNLIVLDTNFLLDIIQNPTNIAQRYIEALEKVKNNIYIPYLVALEFNFRKSGIKKEKHYNINKYKDKVKNTLEKLKKDISDHDLINIKKNTKDFSSELLKEVENFENKILNMLDKKVSIAITEEENTIYKRLIDIIENKIGEEYSQNWIDEIEEEGQKRYTEKLPPGFNDEIKEDTEVSSRRYNNICYQRKFGDLIIWKDIINHSKNKPKLGSKIIYVTNDGQSNKKSDLLYKVKDLIIGPHIYLMNELQKESQKELYVLSNLRFIQLATELSDLQIEEMKFMSNKWIQREEYSNIEKRKIIETKLSKMLEEIMKNSHKEKELIRELEKFEELEESYFGLNDIENTRKKDLKTNKNLFDFGNSNIKDKIEKLKEEIYFTNKKNEIDEKKLNGLLKEYTKTNNFLKYKSKDYEID